jgi:hypothetical protein
MANNIIAFDKSVSSASALNSDSSKRVEIIILADINNTDSVKIGVNNSITFPLIAGASISLKNSRLADIYVEATSGTQTLHVIAGGN